MNVLVVDDQKEVVAGLLEGLHWKGLAIDSVYPAYSAQEARTVFSNYSIDILLCDIEMPQENGLSLLRWVVEYYPQTECIFLTSHAEFVYAQEAISLGSFDYILQPARYEEIESSIRRVQLKLLKSRKNLQLEKVSSYKEEITDGMANNYLYEIINYRQNVAENIRKILSLKLKRKYEHVKICPVLLQIVRWKSGYAEWDSILLRRSINNIFQEIFTSFGGETILLDYEKHVYILLLCGEQEAWEENTEQELCYRGLLRYQQFEEKYMDFVSALYQGDVIMGEDFLGEVDGLNELMKQNILCQNNVFRNQGESHRQRWDKMELFHMERWAEWMMEQKGELIRREINNYFGYPSYQPYEYAAVLKKLHCGFTASLVEILKKKSITYDQIFPEGYTLEDYMMAFDTYEHFLEAVDHVLKMLEEVGGSTASEEDQVYKAVKYIKENLEKKLTREDVAVYVHLNEDYLSRVFKEKTGYTIREYIIKEKMKLAKELLASTNMSISIIALKTGFVNFSHFSRIFKKCEGITPNEYRERVKSR